MSSPSTFWPIKIPDLAEEFEQRVEWLKENVPLNRLRRGMTGYALGMVTPFKWEHKHVAVLELLDAAHDIAYEKDVFSDKYISMVTLALEQALELRFKSIEEGADYEVLAQSLTTEGVIGVASGFIPNDENSIYGVFANALSKLALGHGYYMAETGDVAEAEQWSVKERHQQNMMLNQNRRLQ